MCLLLFCALPGASLALTFNMVVSTKNPVFVPSIFSIHRHLDAKLMWFDSSFKRAVASSMDIAMVKSESNLFTFHLDG